MGLTTIVTLIGVALTAAALAIYLTIIAVTLNQVSFELGTILIGIKAIENQTAPLDSVVGDILRDISAIDKDLSDFVGRATRPRARARARR